MDFAEMLASLATEWAAFGRPAIEARGERRPWYRIENSADGAASTDIHIMDSIGGWGITAAEFLAEMGAVRTPRLTLHINSMGGDVFEGLAIYNALMQRGGVDVQIDSLAASIASVIALAGETVSIAPASMMMIHDAAGDIGYAPAAEHRDIATLLDKVSDMIAGTYAQRTETPAAGWRNLMLAESWFSAEEAVEAGLADRVVGIAAPVNEARLEGFRFKGRQAAPTPVAHRPAHVEPAQPAVQLDAMDWYNASAFAHDAMDWYDASAFSR